jgi:hypothetical protein
MPITFENDNEVIVYALERVIAYARRTQQIFVAQCDWWLAAITGYERELISHINNLRSQEEPAELQADLKAESEILKKASPSCQVHPERILQVSNKRAVSATPRDLAEDQ